MRATTAISAAAILLGTAQACSEVANNQVTFYGFPDNDPPSDQVAHNCGGRNYHAGGTGTYADPLTFATAPGEFSPCELVYLPLLKKYIRYEDDCAQCTSDWKGGKHHIDLWTGNNKSGGQAQVNCENELTSGGQYTVLRQPPQGLEVNSSPLWDGKCHKENVFESNKAGCSSAGAVSDSGNSTATAEEPQASSSGSGGKKGSDKGKSGKGKGKGKGQATSAVGSPAATVSSAPTKSADAEPAASSAPVSSGTSTDGGEDDEDCDEEENSGDNGATPKSQDGGNSQTGSPATNSSSSNQTSTDDQAATPVSSGAPATSDSSDQANSGSQDGGNKDQGATGSSGEGDAEDCEDEE